MKKFLLIALISASAVAVNAQSPFAKNDHHDRNDRPAPAQRGYDQQADRQHQLDNKIAAINNNYNNRINDLQHSPYMRLKDRRRQIRQLEKERTVALQQCRDSFSRDYGGASHTHRL